MFSDSEKALRQTYEHIFLVQKLLASAQIELMRRQFTHDRSKLIDPEWSLFEEFTKNLAGLTYGDPEYEEQRKRDVGIALENHYKYNRHHPEYFKDGVNGMNLFDLLEMFLDWSAAVRRHDDGDINRSIEYNQQRFGLSLQLAEIFKNTVDWVKDEFESLETQKDLGA